MLMKWLEHSKTSPDEGSYGRNGSAFLDGNGVYGIYVYDFSVGRVRKLSGIDVARHQ